MPQIDEDERLEKLMEVYAERSPIIGINWDDISRIAEALTYRPLHSGHQLDNTDVGSVLGLILRAGYTIIKVGPTNPEEEAVCADHD